MFVTNAYEYCLNDTEKFTRIVKYVCILYTFYRMNKIEILEQSFSENRNIYSRNKISKKSCTNLNIETMGKSKMIIIIIR